MKKKIIIIGIIILVVLAFVSNSFAITTSDYEDIYKGGMPQKVKDVGDPLIGIIQIVGTGIAVIMLTVIGIKYVMASADEKANLKGQLVIFIIGAILLFAGSNIFAIIAKSANSLTSSGG